MQGGFVGGFIAGMVFMGVVIIMFALWGIVKSFKSAEKAVGKATGKDGQGKEVR